MHARAVTVGLLATVTLAGLIMARTLLQPETVSMRLALPLKVRVTAINKEGATLTQNIRDSANLGELEADAEFLRPVAPASRAGCPPDNGSLYRVIFSYPRGGDIVAEVHRTGCELVVLPGRFAPTLSWTNPRLLRDLDRVFPPSWQSGF